MKVVMFSTVEPLGARLSSVGSGMLTLLSYSPRIDEIKCYCQVSGEIPNKAQQSKIHLHKLWRVDKPFSLIRTFFHMLREAKVDSFFFNLSLTMFGRRRISNTIGLLIPSLISKLKRKRVVIYMHDFIETEEVSKHGYKAGHFSKLLVSLLEKFLIDNSTLIAPRTSQQITLESKYKRPVETLVIPYVEGISGLLSLRDAPLERRIVDGIINVLLFGKWGPQKDLTGGLHLLLGLIKQGVKIHVTVAGGANPNFPSYEKTLKEAIFNFPQEYISFVPKVLDEDIPGIFGGTDFLFLPYRASGGYSGVMNLAAAYNTRVIAYDVENLRESASILNVDAFFIDPTDSTSQEKLKSVLCDKRTDSVELNLTPVAKLEKAQAGIETLVNLLEPRRSSVSRAINERRIEKSQKFQRLNENYQTPKPIQLTIPSSDLIVRKKTSEREKTHK